MKRRYFELQLKILPLDEEDILTTSGDNLGSWHDSWGTGPFESVSENEEAGR